MKVFVAIWHTNVEAIGVGWVFRRMRNKRSSILPILLDSAMIIIIGNISLSATFQTNIWNRCHTTSCCSLYLLFAWWSGMISRSLLLSLLVLLFGVEQHRYPLSLLTLRSSHGRPDLSVVGSALGPLLLCQRQFLSTLLDTCLWPSLGYLLSSPLLRSVYSSPVSSMVAVLGILSEEVVDDRVGEDPLTWLAPRWGGWVSCDATVHLLLLACELLLKELSLAEIPSLPGSFELRAASVVGNWRGGSAEGARLVCCLRVVLLTETLRILKTLCQLFKVLHQIHADVILSVISIWRLLSQSVFVLVVIIVQIYPLLLKRLFDLFEKRVSF